MPFQHTPPPHEDSISLEYKLTWQWESNGGGCSCVLLLLLRVQMQMGMRVGVVFTRRHPDLRHEMMLISELLVNDKSTTLTARQ